MGDQHAGKKVVVPTAGRQVWEWFRELDKQRTVTRDFGVAVFHPIDFKEIASWSALRAITLRQWQIDAILELDLKRRILAAEKAEEAQSGEVVVTDQPMTKSLFRSIFGGKKNKG